MRVVVDTNVLISGTFFGGRPGMLVDAIAAKALFVVSGDKDLLDLGSYEAVEIITAAEFCERYL